MYKKVLGLALGALVTAGLATGCGSSSDNSGGGGGGGGGGSKGSIKVGGLFTLTPQAFGNDAVKMARQVFDEQNAAGGINGRKIEYLTGDDTANPTQAAQLARKFVGQGAVAMVGTTSFVDCGTNHGYYEKQDIASIVGIGADPFCFTTPNVVPVNIGPFTSITADLYYATKFLKDKRICIFLAPTPGSKDAQDAAVDRWTQLTGQKPVVMDDSLPLTESNFTPYLLRAKNANCDAIFRNGSDTTGLSILKAAKNQGMQDVDFLFDASSYTAQLAKSASPLGMRVYLASEFEPYTETEGANADWIATAERGRINETAFTQGAYVSAKWLIEVLRSMKGDITRQTVLAELRKGTPYNNPMVGSPLVMGDAKEHAPNQAIKMVSIKNGNWEVENKEFFTLPQG